MNMKHFKIILLFTLLLTVISCRKADYKATEPVTVNPIVNTDKAGLNQLFSSLHTAPSTFTITAGIYKVLRAPQGTKLTFYPNSFRDKNGHVISSGTVQIQITEMYRPGSMIANRATTMSNGRLLKSGGQVYITATMNGAEVFVNKYGIGFLAPQPAQETMALFYGNTNNVDSLVNWPVFNTTKGTIVSATVVDTMSLYVIYTSGSIVDTTFVYKCYNQFDSTSTLTWVNCDFFADSTSGQTNVKVIPTDTSFNAFNTEVFIVLPGINGVTAVSNYDPLTHTFSLYDGSRLPTGVTVDIIAISNKGGNFYYYQQNDVTLTPDMTFNPVMIPRTVSYINSALSVL